jgi:radical SAM superfamily enzyme YgiQ (UPF0313 family)
VTDAPGNPSRIRQRPLEEHVPQGAGLRSYLAGKLETGAAPAPLEPQALVAFGEPRSDWPRCLLVAPPMCASEGSVKRVIPPLGLSYIAAYLEHRGIPCDVLDCVVEGVHHEEYLGDRLWRYGLPSGELARRVADEQYEVVGLSLLYSSDLESLLDCARAIKTRRPDIVIVAGGLHPSIYPHEFLRDAQDGRRPLVDFVIRGEGEERFASFLENMKAGTIDLAADGLAGWHEGRLFVNPQRATIADLDRLPFPAYHKLPIERYFEFNVPFSPFPRGRRVMQLYTSRGCPVGCTFCASTNFNKAFRARSVDNVIEEVRHFVERYAIDEIQFADDNLTFNRARSIELFRRLRDVGLPWCTPNGIMVNTLDQELLDLMVDSGMYQITLSIDSGNARVLKELHRKPVHLPRVRELISHLHARDVLIHGTLVVGTVGETLDDIRESFEFVRGLEFDSIGVFIAQALPGSELYEVSLDRGLITPARARRIDTSRAQISLTGIEPELLEETVRTFLYEYNERVARFSPAAWERKYRAHVERLPRICVGRAAPNTDAILKAAEHRPLAAGLLLP